MKKIIFIILLLVFVSGCTLISQKSSQSGNQKNTNAVNQQQTKEYCESVGAEYKGFSNGCMDSCAYKRNPQGQFCTMNAPWGCYCGENKCWNGSGCEKL